MTNWYISKSKIHGVGVFALQDIFVNEPIDVAIDSNNTITLFGSKINHSFNNNTKLVYDGIRKNYYLYATKNIQKNEELLANYNQDTPDFIKKANPEWK